MARYYYDVHVALYNKFAPTVRKGFSYTFSARPISGGPSAKYDYFPSVSFSSSVGWQGTGDKITKYFGDYPIIGRYVIHNKEALKILPEVSDVGTNEYHDVEYNGVSNVQGNYIETIIAEDGEYPSNGYHSSTGLWYVRGDLVFPEIKMRINGQLKTSENGWVKINGQLREIDTIWTKINGALREVE